MSSSMTAAPRSSSPCLRVFSFPFLPALAPCNPSLLDSPSWPVLFGFLLYFSSSSPVVHCLLSSFAPRLPFSPPPASPVWRCVCSFSPCLSFFFVALFLTLLLHQTSSFTPFSFGFSPLPLFHLCPGWRVPAPLLLLLRFTSCLSFCGVKDTKKRWSCHLCFLSLLVVATYNAELAAWMSHCIVPPLLPATF